MLATPKQGVWLEQAESSFPMEELGSTRLSLAQIVRPLANWKPLLAPHYFSVDVITVLPYAGQRSTWDWLTASPSSVK